MSQDYAPITATDETPSPEVVPMIPPTQRHNARSCLLIGCGAALLLVVLAAVAVFLCVRSVSFGLLEKFAESQPRQLPALTVSDDRARESVNRIDAFITACSQGTVTEPLVLTSDDINIYIQKSPDMEPLNGKVYVTLEGDTVRLEWSTSMASLAWLGLSTSDKYFNGSITGTFAMDETGVSMTCTSLECGKQIMPNSQRFTEGALREAEKRETFREIRQYISKIAIHDGKATITPKSTTKSQPKAEAEPS